MSLLPEILRFSRLHIAHAQYYYNAESEKRERPGYTDGFLGYGTRRVEMAVSEADNFYCDLFIFRFEGCTESYVVYACIYIHVERRKKVKELWAVRCEMDRFYG